MSFPENSSQKRRNHIQPPALGPMRKAEGIEYIAVDGLPPSALMFTCDRYRTRMLTTACAKRWAGSFGWAGAVGEHLSLCRACPIGSCHAGASVLRPSILAGLMICLRCGRGSVKLVRGILDPSCSNREYEFRKGRNAKGTAPVKVKLAKRTVRFRIGDDGEVQEKTFLTADAGEAVMIVQKFHAGAQIVDIIENGESIRPRFTGFDPFVRGPYRWLRCRTINGEPVIVEIEPPSTAPAASAAADSAERLAASARWAETVAQAAPYDARIAEKANRDRFTEAELEEIDSLIMATIAARGKHTSMGAVARALNEAGLRMPGGGKFSEHQGFVGRRMVELGLRTVQHGHGDKRQGLRALDWAESLRAVVEGLIAEGVTSATVLADRLNQANHRTRWGRPWTKATCSQLLGRLRLRKSDRDGAHEDNNDVVDTGSDQDTDTAEDSGTAAPAGDNDNQTDELEAA